MVVCSEPPPPLKLPESKITELTDDANHDSPKLEKRTRMHHIERHRSCVVTLTDMELNDWPPRRQAQTLEVTKSPGGGSQRSFHEEAPTDTNASDRHAIADAEWETLKRSIDYFRGQPIGTVAEIEKSQGAALNYDQVFMRAFMPSALAFLMKGEHLIVKKFLVETARPQSREKIFDLFKLGQGVIPASFKVHHRSPTQKTESLLADFGETAIGRVAPADSGLWWILLLRAYTKWTGDNSLAESPNCQRAMQLILSLCLSEGCDSSPMLCADGCSMIDRRMGRYGYRIKIRALLYMALRCALSLLTEGSDDDFLHHTTKRTKALSYHLHSYYWLDLQELNDIYHYKTEECSQTALNKFNVMPESIPDSIFDFMHSHGGCFIGNVSPARMDFRWFCLGSFISILSSLATREQVRGSWWGTLRHAYTKLICHSSLAKSPPFQKAIYCSLLWIIFGCDATAILLCADSYPLTDIAGLCLSDGYNPSQALLFADGCYNIDRRMDSLMEIGATNTVVIYLDDPMPKFFESYRNGIGSLRRYCEVYGTRIDVSRIFGDKTVVFTTPSGGTFNFKIVYGGRAITFKLYGRNLYIMGWKGPHGTIEIKAPSEIRSNYLSGEDIIIIPKKKNYSFLVPNGNVSSVRLGPFALREAFEVLSKFCAIATYAVHLPEAGRLQDVFRDICSVFQDACSTFPSFPMVTLGTENADWVENYGHRSHMLMKRIECLLSRTTTAETRDHDGILESDVRKFKNIRILLRDAYNSGRFVHEAAPAKATEEDPGLGNDDNLRGTKSSRKHSRLGKDKRGLGKMPRQDEHPPGGDGESAPTFPSYLLEDWCPNVDDRDEQDEEIKKEEISKTESKEDTKKEAEIKKIESKGRDGDKAISFEDYLAHFPAIQKLVDFKNKVENHLQAPLKSIERSFYRVAIDPVSPASLKQLGMKCAVGRMILPQRHPIQPRSLLRAAPIISKLFRFVR